MYLLVHDDHLERSFVGSVAAEIKVNVVINCIIIDYLLCMYNNQPWTAQKLFQSSPLKP